MFSDPSVRWGWVESKIEMETSVVLLSQSVFIYLSSGNKIKVYSSMLHSATSSDTST